MESKIFCFMSIVSQNLILQILWSIWTSQTIGWLRCQTLCLFCGTWSNWIWAVTPSATKTPWVYLVLNFKTWIWVRTTLKPSLKIYCPMPWLHWGISMSLPIGLSAYPQECLRTSKACERFVFTWFDSWFYFAITPAFIFWKVSEGLIQERLLSETRPSNFFKNFCKNLALNTFQEFDAKNFFELFNI